MPIDYSKYPPNWKSEIVPSILARAGEIRDEKGNVTTQAKCEQCGVTNKEFGIRDINTGKWYTWEDFDSGLAELEGAVFEKPGQPLRMPYNIVLTVAHLDHDEENHDVSMDRLQALCQRCHLNHDRPLRGIRRDKKRGQGQLFETKAAGRE